jgi:Flp pilus assembly protein TadD
LARFPDRDDYRMGLADIEIGAKRFQDARALLEQLAGKHPDSSEICKRLGSVQNQLGDRAAALQNLRRAHQLNPADFKVALSLAVLFEASGDLEQARAAYEDVLKVDPDNTQAMNNLAYMKADQGVDLNRALGLAQRALQRSPHDPNIADTLALVYIRKKLAGPAVEVLRDLVTSACKSGFPLTSGDGALRCRR